MPRRRESAATPPTIFQRDNMPLPSHRKSPSFASMSSAAQAAAAAAQAAADVRPPPAHANKVKTEPYLRDISPSSYEQQHGGRPLTTQSPHGMPGGTSPSPGPPRPPSSSSRGGGIMPPTTQAYMGRNPLSQPSISTPGRSQPALSPKISSSGKALTIQTGSITQGTPVQQGAQQRYGEQPTNFFSISRNF